MYLRLLLSANLVLGALAGLAAAQPISGKVTLAGLPTPGAQGGIIRGGQWFPIRVQLALQGTGMYPVELHFETVDLDGDRVTLRRPQVTLSSEGGGGGRSVWCYGLVNAANELPRHIDVINDEGVRVAELPLPRCEMIANDDLVILDISDQPVGMDRLMTPGWTPGQDTSGDREFYRDVVVSVGLRAADLPDRWWGLEMVDVIVWDRPDPSVLSIPQLDALLAWVRNGGQLIVGVGSAWEAIRSHQSGLSEIMPLAGAAEAIELNRLDVLLARVGRGGERDTPLRAPVAVTTADVASGAVRTVAEFGGPSGAINLVTMRLVDSGRVVATAASLRDLTTIPQVDDEALFAELIDLNRYTQSFREAQGNWMQAAIAPEALQAQMTEPIGFGTATALRGLTAFLFVAAYILLATVAAWVWLRQKRLAHLNWPIFALCAIVASVLSLGTVGAMRSLSRGVQSMCVLDLVAGQDQARGYCLMGYRSPLRQRVELSLPGESSFLRPLARGRQAARYYVTPARYTATPRRARLEDVLMRATLKQVEGHWTGQVGGTILGNLVLDRQSGRIAPASWLTNNLDVALDDAYLLFIDPRQDDAGVPRAAGLTVRYDRPDKPSWIPPAMNVLAVRVGQVPAGTRVTQLGSREYERVMREQNQWAQRNGKPENRPDLPTLWHAQQYWRGNIGFASLLNRSVRATLLASTQSYHLHNRGADFNAVDAPLSAEGLPPMDITHWLIRGEAVLIGWTAAPSPVPLVVNESPQSAYDGLTVYRVRVPVRYTGSPPPREVPVP